jgi:hypothetical protein
VPVHHRYVLICRGTRPRPLPFIMYRHHGHQLDLDDPFPIRQPFGRSASFFGCPDVDTSSKADASGVGCNAPATPLDPLPRCHSARCTPLVCVVHALESTGHLRLHIHEAETIDALNFSAHVAVRRFTADRQDVPIPKASSTDTLPSEWNGLERSTHYFRIASANESHVQVLEHV